MKHFLLLIILTLFALETLGQRREDTTKFRTANNPITTPTQVSVCLPDTLAIRNISGGGNNQLLEKYMPWIVALLIGVLSVLGNIILSNQNRKANDRNLKSQIESSERNLQKQMDTAKETTLIQFKATIATKNRQEWINELRQNLSEYMAMLHMITPESDKISDLLTKRADHIQRLLLTKTKLELLLNKDRAEQKELLDQLENVLSIINFPPKENFNIAFSAARTRLIDAARKLFEIHWKKIKDLN